MSDHPSCPPPQEAGPCRTPEVTSMRGRRVFDILSLVVGLVVGGLAVAIAIETTGRPREKETSLAKLTTGWRLSELRDPVVVARDVVDVDVPAGTRIVASGLVDATVQDTCKVRQVPPVRTEFALDSETGRAFLFTAGVRRDAMALLTVDPATIQRLETEFRTLWDRSDPYVERLRVQELAGRQGVTVEVDGVVQDVLPFQDRFMIRLEDQGSIIGVLSQKDPSELVDERIRVQGRLEKDKTGYPVIEAHDIRRIR